MTEKTKLDPIEFTCMDCGIHVIAFGCWQGNMRCATCQWLSEIPDPVDREKLREFLADVEPNHE